MMKLIYVYSRSQTRPSQPKTSIANPKARPIILQSPESKLLGRVNQKKAKGVISHADNPPKEKRKSNLKRPISKEEGSISEVSYPVRTLFLLSRW